MSHVVEVRRELGRLSLGLMTFALASCAAESDANPEAADRSAQNAAASADAAPASALTDRVWVRVDSSDLPGRMRIFLSDGTLLMDSCWETYRLAEWSRLGSDSLVWSEDNQEIRAEVVEESDATLRLRLALLGGVEEEIYRPAVTPYVCPDMVR